GSKADFNVSLGYLERTDRQPQNEDNSTGLMVDAIAGTARTDLQDTRLNPLNGYNIYPIRDILAQEPPSDVNRFTNSLNARYYPFAWLSTRANLGFDFIMNHNKTMNRFEQGPCCGTGRQGSITDRRQEDDQYTADIGATATFNPTSSINSKTSVGVQYFRA